MCHNRRKGDPHPADPLPVQDPRVDNFPDGNFGFTQYNAGAPIDFGMFTQASVLLQIAFLARSDGAV